MATLQDYGIRNIWHGEWSDPEIEWKKSDFQTVLFNYWDVAECTDYESIDLQSDADLQLLVAQLWELTPDSYTRPKIDYEWEISSDELYDSYDDADYYKDYKLSPKEDFILHTTSQALRQALNFLDDENCVDAEIRIFRNVRGRQTLVANYILQGSTLKDIMSYKK